MAALALIFISTIAAAVTTFWVWQKDQERADRKRLLDQATWCGDSDKETVHCDICGNLITLNSEFSVDEDGRAYCEAHT